MSITDEQAMIIGREIGREIGKEISSTCNNLVKNYESNTGRGRLCDIVTLFARQLGAQLNMKRGD